MSSPLEIQRIALHKATRVQARVVGALLIREMLTRYGRRNIGFAWLFVEPMLFTLGITALWTLTHMYHGSSLSPVAFAVTGYASVLLWRNAANRCAKAVEPNLGLLFHRNVTVLDLLLSRIVLEVVGSTAALLGLLAVFIALGYMPLPDDVLRMLAAWGLLAWFGCGLGLIVGALSERSDVFERAWHTLAYLLFPVSGAVFLVDWLPVAARELVLWLPMVHGVEMMRHGYFGAAIRTYEDVGYVVTANLVLTLIGLVLANEAGRRVEPQ